MADGVFDRTNGTAPANRERDNPSIGVEDRSTFDRYLRELGSVAILTRDQEVELVDGLRAVKELPSRRSSSALTLATSLLTSVAIFVVEPCAFRMPFTSRSTTTRRQEASRSGPSPPRAARGESRARM